jgi:acyl-CoA thioesterase-1
MHRLVPALLLILMVHGLCAAEPLAPKADGTKLRIACVGEMTTASTHGQNVDEAYPAELQRLMGDKFDVRNFGIWSATVTMQGDVPYLNQEMFGQVKEFKPEVVVLVFGANDSREKHWVSAEDFGKQYKSFIAKFKELEGTPRIYLCTPPFVFGGGKYGVKPHNLDKLIPEIRKLAEEEGLPLVDLYTRTSKMQHYFPDHVQVNATGAGVLADTVYEALLGKKPRG